MVRKENCLNLGDGGCSEPRWHHCTPTWVTVFYIYTNTHTHTQTQTYKHTYTTYTNIHIHKHKTDTQTHTHRHNIHKYKHAQIQIYKHTHRHKCIHSHTPSQMHRLTQSYTKHTCIKPLFPSKLTQEQKKKYFTFSLTSGS